MQDAPEGVRPLNDGPRWRHAHSSAVSRDVGGPPHLGGRDTRLPGPTPCAGPPLGQWSPASFEVGQCELPGSTITSQFPELSRMSASTP